MIATSPTCVRRTRTCAHTRALSRRTSRGSAWRRSAPSRSTTTGSSTATPTSVTSSRSGHVRATCSGSASASTASRRHGQQAWTERPYAARPPTRSSAPSPVRRSGAGEPERGEYERVREQIVTSLVAEVAEAAGDTPLEFLELSGAVKGYADGRPEGDPAPSIAWQLGGRRGCGRPRMRRDRGDRLRGRSRAGAPRPRRLRRRRGAR